VRGIVDPELPRARDRVRQQLAVGRRRHAVFGAVQHQRRHDDPGDPVRCIVVQCGAALDSVLVRVDRVAQAVGDVLGDPSGVPTPRGLRVAVGHGGPETLLEGHRGAAPEEVARGLVGSHAESAAG